VDTTLITITFIVHRNQRLIFLLKAGFFALVVYFPLFMHLENLPIRQWDESRLAMNAYEMNKNGNFIVTHYQGSPDMWNTKPPLMIWLQVLFIKLLGAGELAIRLPAALAALFTCAGLLIFSTRVIKSYWPGILAVLVLVTSDGYIANHVSRTGDYDALLIMTTTFYALFFVIFLESGEIRFIYLTAAGLIAAVLTKGIAGLLFTPALFIYLLLKNKLVVLLKNKHLYASFAAFVLIAGGYYFLREHYNPGYWEAVMENELGGRYFETLEGHQHPYWYYFFNIVEVDFVPWYLLVPLGVLFGLFHKNPVVKNLTIYLLLLVLVYFFAVSSGKTRLHWYSAPLFPFLSLLVALFLWYWLDFFTDSDILRYNLRRNVLPVAFLFMIFVSPYSKIIDKVYKPQEPVSAEQYAFLTQLQKGLQGKKNLNHYSLCYTGEITPARFYIHLLQDKGIKIMVADSGNLRPGDRVMAFQQDVKKKIEELYEVTVKEEFNNVKVYDIIHECRN